MTKDDLKEYTSIKRELKQIQFKLKELEERKTSIKSMVISDMNVQTSHNNNSIEDLLIKIEECIEEYNKKEIELNLQIQENKKEVLHHLLIVNRI
jgi:flagellar biosynthesis chaperone FliJ